MSLLLRNSLRQSEGSWRSCLVPPSLETQGKLMTSAPTYFLFERVTLMSHRNMWEKYRVLCVSMQNCAT